jgi:hypothetical protein
MEILQEIFYVPHHGMLRFVLLAQLKIIGLIRPNPCYHTESDDSYKSRGLT